MNNYKISFIGTGNMAEAIFSKAIEENIISTKNIMVCDINKDRLSYINEKYRIITSTVAQDAVDFADIIFASVKPQYFNDAFHGLKSSLKGKSVVSIMAGVPIGKLKLVLGDDCKVLRVMPNTPALVGEAMSVLCSETDLTEGELAFTKDIFNTIGEVEMLSEKHLDAVTGVSGSGPAYVYMFIEAMADAGVLNGLPRDVAYKLAAQTVLGSAKTVLDTGKHPGVLKDMVTSPGGTTIEALASFENDKFRAAVINAVNAATKKSKDLGKK